MVVAARKRIGAYWATGQGKTRQGRGDCGCDVGV